MSNTRATTAKLAPGEDTIMRSGSTVLPNGTVSIKWSYKPMDGSPTVRTTTRGKTLGQARMRARARLAELEAATGGSDWKPNHRLEQYIEHVSKPAIAKAQLAQLTLDRYQIALGLLLGQCSQHEHKHGLDKHTIVSGTRFKALENLLTEIAQLHGRETARQSRTVLTKYILTRLTRDELIDGNPIAGVRLNELTGTRPGERTRGGKALSLAEYESVLEYLLELDPADGVMRRQGRWTLEHLIAKRRNTIDQALLQAATGLRSTEANLLQWDKSIEVKPDGTMFVHVTEDAAKGGVYRTALVLDVEVTKRMLERRARAKSGHEYVIGSPADPNKPWDRDNRNHAAQGLYLQIAREVNIPVLKTERSHVWRTTLYTLYGGGSVPTAVIDFQFGNSPQTRAKHYTDPTDLTSLQNEANKIRTLPKVDTKKLDTKVDTVVSTSVPR